MIIGRLIRKIAGRAVLDAARRTRDRWKIFRLERSMNIRQWHKDYLFARLTQWMGLASLIEARRRREWTPHIAGLLLLFVSALYFHEDFTRRES